MRSLGKAARASGSDLSSVQDAKAAETCGTNFYLVGDQVIEGTCITSDPEGRGHQVSQVLNALEMFNDKIRYNELGVDFRTDKKPRGKSLR